MNNAANIIHMIFHLKPRKVGRYTSVHNFQVTIGREKARRKHKNCYSGVILSLFVNLRKFCEQWGAEVEVGPNELTF